MEPESTPSREERVRELLLAAETGDPLAAKELLPILYEELRGLARALQRKGRFAEQLGVDGIRNVYRAFPGGVHRAIYRYHRYSLLRSYLCMYMHICLLPAHMLHVKYLLCQVLHYSPSDLRC